MSRKGDCWDNVVAESWKDATLEMVVRDYEEKYLMNK